MEKILENLALIGLNKFCDENGIDYSGSRVIYDGCFKYTLARYGDGKLLASVQFHKSSVPTYTKPI